MTLGMAALLLVACLSTAIYSLKMTMKVKKIIFWVAIVAAATMAVFLAAGLLLVFKA